jgi:YaiO family outer membrane protein
VIRRLGALIVLGTLAGTAMLAQDEELSAHSLIAHQEFAAARSLYEQLLKRDPQNLEYQIWIARLSAWLKEYPTSIETYDRVLERQPRNAEALVGKAYAEMWQHHYAEAGELLARAEKQSPEDPDVQVALARMRHYQGEERAAKKYVSRALQLDPDNAEARQLGREVDVPRPIEVRVGFAQDRFSFTNAGNMGLVSVGYIGQINRITLQYEEWSRFEERTRRAQLNFTRKLSSGWWLRIGATAGPGALTIPRYEYTGGFSRALPRRFVLDTDYRMLRFRAADVHLLSPALTYYFAKPAWVTATFYQAWTNWRTAASEGLVSHSWVGQYNLQVAKPVVLHAGYARGSENFQVLSIDRLGLFQANTYLVGTELRLTHAYSAELFSSYQSRSNHQHQTSFGVNFTIRQ